jgi:hypothetical protein
MFSSGFFLKKATSQTLKKGIFTLDLHLVLFSSPESVMLSFERIGQLWSAL